MPEEIKQPTVQDLKLKLNDFTIILDKMVSDYQSMLGNDLNNGSVHQAMLRLIEAKLWTINALSSLVDAEIKEPIKA